MNIWIISYIIMGVIWAGLSFLGTAIANYQKEEQDITDFKLFFVGIPICLLWGAIWPITLFGVIIFNLGKKIGIKTR